MKDDPKLSPLEIPADRDTFIDMLHSQPTGACNKGGYHRQCREEPDADHALWELRSALASYRGVADLVLGHTRPPPHYGELEGVSATNLFNMLDVLNDNLDAVCDYVERSMEK